MHHLNSARVPATVIFTALLVVILVSSSRTSYKRPHGREGAPSAGYALAASGSVPLALRDKRENSGKTAEGARGDCAEPQPGPHLPMPQAQ